MLERTETTPPWPHGQALLSDIASASPPAGALALWHIGQSGFVVRGGGLTLVFDPYLNPTDRRTFPPPFTGAELRGVDYVFCSHDHSDHLDPTAVKAIAQGSPRARFVISRAAQQKMESLGLVGDRLLIAPVDETLNLGDLTVHAVPAAHGDKADPIAECVWEADPERGHRFVGFVVGLNGVRLYHAGDTTVYPGMVERLQRLKVDLALLPINGRDWFREQRNIIGNTDHREAADLGHAIGADTIVPMHYDMFAGNPGNPGWFVEYCTAQYPGQGFHVPIRCKRWVYVK